MQIRGGLLIEPWKPFRFYTNAPKEQSIVSFDDAIYICNTSHQSSDSFLANADKFTSVGSGGGGGGGGGGTVGNRYAGQWDMRPGPGDIDQAVPSPVLSSSTLKVDDDTFQISGLELENIIAGAHHINFARAEGQSVIDSGIRSGSFKIPPYQAGDTLMGQVFVICNASATLQDILNAFTGSPPVGTFISSNVIYNFAQLNGGVGSGYYVQCNTYNNGITSALWRSLPNGNTIQVGDDIYWDFDTLTGKVYFSVNAGAATEVATMDLNAYPTNEPFHVAYLPIWSTSTKIINGGTSTQDRFDLGSTRLGRLPFLSGTLAPITPPVGASDGKVYLVTYPETYLGITPSVGDFVEFADNMTRLIRTHITDTTLLATSQQVIESQTSLETSIANVLTQAVDGVIQIYSIANHFNSGLPLNQYMMVSAFPDGDFSLLAPGTLVRRTGAGASAWEPVFPREGQLAKIAGFIGNDGSGTPCPEFFMYKTTPPFDSGLYNTSDPQREYLFQMSRIARLKADVTGHTEQVLATGVWYQLPWGSKSNTSLRMTELNVNGDALQPAVDVIPLFVLSPRDEETVHNVFLTPVDGPTSEANIEVYFVSDSGVYSHGSSKDCYLSIFLNNSSSTDNVLVNISFKRLPYIHTGTGLQTHAPRANLLEPLSLCYGSENQGVVASYYTESLGVIVPPNQTRVIQYRFRYVTKPGDSVYFLDMERVDRTGMIQRYTTEDGALLKLNAGAVEHHIFAPNDIDLILETLSIHLPDESILVTQTKCEYAICFFCDVLAIGWENLLNRSIDITELPTAVVAGDTVRFQFYTDVEGTVRTRVRFQ